MYARVIVTVLIAVGVTQVAKPQGVDLRRQSNQIDIVIDGQLFASYHFDPQVAKPFFLPLRSAQGTVVTRGFPVRDEIPPGEEKDPELEPHQRGMYFAHGNVNGIDYWGEAAFTKWSDDSAFGRTVLHELEQMRGGADSGALRVSFNLESPRGRAIAEEEQAYVFRGDNQKRMIDCEFTIRANHQAPVTMGDTKEGTFAIRLARGLRCPPGHIVNSSGVTDKDAWGKRADWVDFYGNVSGEDVGVAVLDSPKSFRHPTYWHARWYGLLAANPFGAREFTGRAEDDGSWTIPEGKELTFHYRVVVHHGDYKQARIADAYREYAAQQ